MLKSTQKCLFNADNILIKHYLQTIQNINLDSHTLNNMK